MKYPFEVNFEELEADLDTFVSVVFSSLESDFLTLPKGAGFVEYPVFETGYERLKSATQGFREMDADAILKEASSFPIILIVLRSMLGFTPPEWAYVASQRSGTNIDQGYVRSQDRRIRMDPRSRFG